MATTVIECSDKPVLDGFEHAIRFFAEEAYIQRFRGFVVVETEDDWADITYLLTRQGLEVKHQGVQL